MRMLIIVLSFLSLVGWGIGRTYESYAYNRECGGYLKRAADASTPMIARESLSRALAYMDNNGLNQGYTSLLWRSPDEDVGYWRRNISLSFGELGRLSPTATQLEQTNVLMRVREVLVDNSQNGVEVTEPSGISVYPNNRAWALWAWISLVILCMAVERELKHRNLL